MRFLCPHYKRYAPVRKMEANAFPTSTTCQVLNWKKTNKYELLLCGKTLILRSKQKQSKTDTHTFVSCFSYTCLYVHTWGTVISQGSLEGQNLQNEYKEKVWPRLKGDLSSPQELD